jgi:multiple sugar transport system permease protein
MRSRKFVLTALSPSAVLFALVLVIPTIYVLNLMLHRYSLVDVADNRFVGFDNFVALAADERFWSAMSRSIVFSIVSMSVAMPAGIAIALLIMRRPIGASLLRVALIVPMVLAPLVVGAVFRFLLASGGFIDWLAGLPGVAGLALLARPETSLITVALVDAWQWTPFVAIVVAAAMEAMPKQVLEAARLDGATLWQETRHITLPMIRPVLVIVGLIRFMDSFREFDKLFIMTHGGPGTASETLPILLHRIAFLHLDMGYAAAAGFVMLVVISVISTVIARRFRAARGVAE